MKRRISSVLLLCGALTVGVLTPAFAGGPADKATGDVEWTRNGIDRSALFDAHEAVDERRQEKGSLYQEEWDADGVTATITVSEMTYVDIEGNTGCFAGRATATGTYAPYHGQFRVSHVTDNGEGSASAPDNYAGRFVATEGEIAGMCTQLASINDVSGGNLQIHTAAAHTS